MPVPERFFSPLSLRHNSPTNLLFRKAGTKCRQRDLYLPHKSLLFLLSAFVHILQIPAVSFLLVVSMTQRRESRALIREEVQSIVTLRRVSHFYSLTSDNSLLITSNISLLYVAFSFSGYCHVLSLCRTV